MKKHTKQKGKNVAKTPSKTTKYIYFISTIIISAVLLMGGQAALLGAEQIADSLTQTSMPLYLLPLLGVAKIAAVVAFWLPKKFSHNKTVATLIEWAYAGVAINMFGAGFAHWQSGHTAQQVVVPFVLLAVLIVARVYRGKYCSHYGKY